MTDPVAITVVIIVFLALFFDYVNGFHDAANSIATVVSTRVLSPQVAVFWAAFFNVVAYFVFHKGVANTIKQGVVDPAFMTVAVVAAALVAATAWNLITWYYGLPSSSSHALVGGLAGAAIARGGWNVLVPGGLVVNLVRHGRFDTSHITVVDIVAFILIAPVLGMVLGYILMIAVYWICHRMSPKAIGDSFRKLQLLSAAAYSLGHGGNDAQKTAGIIGAVMAAGGFLGAKSEVPSWVVFTCHIVIGMGTMAGGWRIVKTMGHKICKLQPVHGFSAETAGAITLFTATFWKIPVSTTHTITGSIVGVGSTRGLRAVKWGVAEQVVWAWILTIPFAALVAAGIYVPLSWLIRF
ncbi:MAG: inorganic phosphate transporter [Planctomycetota bacterium]